MPDRLSAEALTTALGGRYRLSRELGSGGMSTVYAAWDEETGREVALKVLLPELSRTVGADRFAREIEIATNLRHPHILPVYGSGSAEEILYYTMPVVEGETLRDRLDREGQLAIEESLEIARQVSGALHYAHEQGVVHRDIKPENIMLSDGGAVVMDFGIARAVEEAGGDRLTETGLAMGTPAYMSPEQAEGSGRVDGRSDQYSLACVLYEMLAGHPPFQGRSSQIVLNRAAKDPVPPLSSARRTVPVPVEAVIERALSKVAADRFASAEGFGEALTLAERGVTPPGVTPGHVTPGGVTPWELGRATNVWTELARRRVYQVAVSYLVVAWAVVQVAEATFGPLEVPLEWHRWLIWALVGGFPVAVALSWLYEVTPRGVRRTVAVGVTPPDELQIPKPRLSVSAAVAVIGVVGVIAYASGIRIVTTGGANAEIEPLPRDADYGLHAIIPFNVSDDLGSYRMSLVDLLHPHFNRAGSAMDAAEVRAAWREVAGADTADVGLIQVRRIARRVGAPWAVHGGLRRTPSGLTLSARRVLVETGQVFGEATLEVAEGDSERALAMLAARLLGEAPQHILEETPTAAISAYNAGVRAEPDFVAAIPNYEQALALDPQFGSAAYRLYYANINAGRGVRHSPLAVRAWELRPRMAKWESDYLLLDYGYAGPGGEIPRSERLAMLDSLTAVGGHHYLIWQIYLVQLQRAGAPLGLPEWRRRAVNAADSALARMPPNHNTAPWVRQTRYEIARDGGEADSAEVNRYGREWAFGYHHAPGWALLAEWRWAIESGDTVAVREMLPRFDEVSVDPRTILDLSLANGYPLDLGAEAAVAATEERATTGPQYARAAIWRVRLETLRGRLGAAVQALEDLRGEGHDPWEPRTRAAYLGLIEPTTRDAVRDLVSGFYLATDTAAVPNFDSMDNPFDRLCMRDIWETAVDARYDRPSKNGARLDDMTWLPRWGSARQMYEAHHCDPTAAAIVEQRSGGEAGNSVAALERLANLDSPGWTGGALAPLTAARLYLERDELEPALEILGRPAGVRDPIFLPAFLFLEAQAADRAGQGERAVTTAARYLTLRTRPDSLAIGDVRQVCDILSRHGAPGDAAAFDQCG